MAMPLAYPSGEGGRPLLFHGDNYLPSPGDTQGADPCPLSSSLAKACRNHLNEEITLLIPTGIGERYSQTISNLGHAALLRRDVNSLYK